LEDERPLWGKQKNGIQVHLILKLLSLYVYYIVNKLPWIDVKFQYIPCI
jgi:hypothetical protein